jgi:hypothetical protein
MDSDLFRAFANSKQKEQESQQAEEESEEYESEEERQPIPKQIKQKPKKQNPKSNDPIFQLLKLPFIAAMVGSPKSGKSFAIRHFLVNLLMKGELQFGMVITGTKFNGAYDFILDQNMVVEGYNEQILKQYLRKLKDYRVANKKAAKAFLILDDMVGQIPWESPLILHALTNYRHYGLTIFIATQYIYKINPTARTVCDYAFIWGQDNLRCYNAIYESFCLGFDDFKHFKTTIDSIVEEPYACLMYSKEKRKFEERFQAYKAPPDIPDVKFRFSKQKEKKENSYY